MDTSADLGMHLSAPGANSARAHLVRDPHDPLITRGSPFANVSDQKHNITCDISPSQSRQTRAQF